MAESVASRTILFSDAEIDFSNIIPKQLGVVKESIDVNSWQDVLKNLCFQLYKISPERIIEKLKDPDFLWIDRRSDLFANSILLNTSLFVEISKSEEVCFNRCKQIVLEFPEIIHDVSVFCLLRNAPEQYLQEPEDIICNVIERWDKESNGKIGRFARCALTYILQNKILSETMFGELFTVDGTQKLLGIRFMGLPLFSFSKMVDKNGYSRSWAEPVVVSNQKIYMVFEWYEKDRTKFLIWIKKVLKEYLEGKHSAMSLERPDDQNDENDAYGEILDRWGKDAL